MSFNLPPSYHGRCPAPILQCSNQAQPWVGFHALSSSPNPSSRSTDPSTPPSTHILPPAFRRLFVGTWSGRGLYYAPMDAPFSPFFSEINDGGGSGQAHPEHAEHVQLGLGPGKAAPLGKKPPASPGGGATQGQVLTPTPGLAFHHRHSIYSVPPAWLIAHPPGTPTAWRIGSS